MQQSLSSIATLTWGAVRTWHFVDGLLHNGMYDKLTIVRLLEVIDTYLLATVLLVFAVGLYELFIGEVTMPAWLQVHDLGDLKVKLSEVIVLVIAVKFLEQFLTLKDTHDLLNTSIAVTLVMGALVAFSAIGAQKH
ncbi:MAG: YqhA family protein [Actinomycetota bacterium]